jgi:hypothetical protein
LANTIDFIVHNLHYLVAVERGSTVAVVGSIMAAAAGLTVAAEAAVG